MKPLPLSVRFLLLGFVPVGLALFFGFQWFRGNIQESVRGGLEKSLVDTQQVQTSLRIDARRQRAGLLATLAENASLKAVLMLAREASPEDASTTALTVQDQLLELAAPLEDAELIGFVDATGSAVAAASKMHSAWSPLPVEDLPSGNKSLAQVRQQLYEVLAVPVNSGSENLGMLIVGKRFDPATFHRQAVLLHDGKVAGQAGGFHEEDLRAAFQACAAAKPCGVTIASEPYLAVPVDAKLLDTGYTLWTLHSVEQASSQLLGTARSGFWVALLAMLGAALLVDLYGARAVTRPLTDLVRKLHESEQSGVLRGDFPENSSTREVNELARAFNLAARSVADSQRRLDEAYLQITQTMAQTLDARDPYTAGHSSRVSDYAVAIAKAMSLPQDEVDIIRVGANLHDIGKIGIPDAVLQKPGSLTAAEFEVIKKHPVIGKRILEGVSKFRDYLSIVELHHENEDGTGYPWGLRGENVPLGARIVHVVDAYDAMTSNRPYREAMPSERAIDILRKNAGSQFDPAVVEVFLRLVHSDAAQALPTVEIGGQLANLGEQLSAEELKVVDHEMP